MKYLSIDQLFQLADNRIPLQTEEAIRGLVQPVETFFANGKVPEHLAEAHAFLPSPEIQRVQTPVTPGAKNEWIQWILNEVKIRYELATRFMLLRMHIEHKRKVPKIILVLRAFREVHYEKDVGMYLVLDKMDDEDHTIRDNIETAFPGTLVLWVANPRDALSYSFYRLAASGVEWRVNSNSIPYLISSEDWLRYVKILSESADVIVMSNTVTGGGVGQEVALLKCCGLLNKTFFAHPNRLEGNCGIVHALSDLTADTLNELAAGQSDKLLELPTPRHWLGHDSIAYVQSYLKTLDDYWGVILDNRYAIGTDVFVSLFVAMGILSILTGHLSAAAESFIPPASAMLLFEAGKEFNIGGTNLIGDFHSEDLLTLDTMRGAIAWCQENAERFGLIYGMRFE